MTDSENWFALAVYIAVAVVVADLATRSRRRAAEAEQREREAALLAGIATGCCPVRTSPPRRTPSQPRSARCWAAAARGSISAAAAIRRPASRRSSSRPPAASSGTLYVRESAAPNLAVRRRFLPALPSLLAVAIDRERLTREALEAADAARATPSRRRCCAPSATTCAPR